MAKAKTTTEVTPDGWAPTQAVDDPILNSPYEEPKQYWRYADGVPHKVPGRRPARYHFKDKQTGAAQQDLFKIETEDDLPLINALRKDVKRWRDSGYRGASAVTKELLTWWIREDRPRRLFFCQREAVETVIYLLELGIPGRLRASGFQNFEVDADNISLLLKGEKPNFDNLGEDFFPRLVDPASDAGLLALRRLGCKMATGSGKTIVMAMLISWAFCNRGRNPSSTSFPNAVLICAPNLTVRKRLSVLRPDDPDNYYDTFDLIPPKYREFMNAGKVLVTNWHIFAPKGEHTEGGKSYAVVNKGEETHDAFTRNRLGELAQRLPILVLNDEGHHCWRGKNLSETDEKKALKDRSKEEQDFLKEEAEEARIWLAGLDRINNSGLIGKDESGTILPGISACVDLSATPFYLANSGYPEGSPFPWLVSDFGLVDAIESGITKVPRLPVKDDQGNKDEAGRPDPVYFRLWDSIKKQLKPEDYISKTKVKPEALFKYAEGALTTLLAQWKVQFDKCKEDAGGKSFIPPVIIVVCDNTEVASIFFREISGEYEEETVNEEGKTVVVKKYTGGLLHELENSAAFQPTIRIDSKLLAKIEAEGDETKDEAALRLRELIDTVGKRGGIGEQVRCVVSVSMLTEGWDANNVTHILGVRAFGSQLLCEQVVGRGLRRVSYDINPETGMLNAEYADVYGIPFSLIPFKGKPKEDKEKPDPVYHSIYAVPERDAYEIRMPNVESYVYALREGGITCDVDKLEALIVDKEPNTVYLAPTRGYQDEATGIKDTGEFIPQTREEYYKTVRPQQVIFRLAQIILDDLAQGAEGGDRGKLKFLARHQLFPELLKIVREYVRKKVTFKEGVDERELALKRYAQLLRERVRDGILPLVAKDDQKLLPVLNSFEPYTSTGNVNYQTCRPVMELEKSHLNRAMLQSSYESQAIEIMEDLDAVDYFTPNDRQIGLIIPYEYEGHRHNYEPDFVVKLKNGKLVLLEIKGMGGKIYNQDLVPAKNAAARKWVAAVNNNARYGEWVFEICEELSGLRQMLELHAGIADENRPFRILVPTDGEHWKTCIPLIALQTVVRKSQEKQKTLDGFGSWSSSWVTWDGHPPFQDGMFVAQVRGDAMEPDIEAGAYGVFSKIDGQDRQGKVVLAVHGGIDDPFAGRSYTVREYHSERCGSDGTDWQHVRVTLKPTNPAAAEFVLDVKDENEVRVLAELVGIL
ncbi:hypothetical protein OR1_02726 [Geobacter sp. OR-1]|uniref:DEAD/DEAH box helicase family protein n=1 Tax=Geobacter sp. OR-1 TaxID=1266765 RepID=UPI000542E3ED|nr:DEAD/DEAH box helicase family protein [Geobacter sp. OR-1]GAM10437.1 hypothetical protein OR1_02726 [Geobacter sp. OR-1]